MLKDLLLEAAKANAAPYRDSAATRKRVLIFLKQWYYDAEVDPLASEKATMNTLVAFIAKETGTKLTKGTYSISEKSLTELSNKFDPDTLPAGIRKKLDKPKPKEEPTAKSTPKTKSPKKAPVEKVTVDAKTEEEPKKPTVDWKDVISTLDHMFKSGSYMSNSSIEKDRNGNDYVEYGFRSWGRWEADSDTSDEDMEDNDYEVLSSESSAELKTLITKLKSQYPVDVERDIGEKNWITLTVTAKK